MAGLDAPTSGTVSTGGRPVAFMFQEPALFPWFTAAQNVGLPLRANGVRRRERHQRVQELLESVHLGGFADKRPHELSGGMRQRVALARALAQDAEVLLMDEPFGALDAMTRDLLHELLEGIWRRQGFSVLFVTHEVREAVRLGDRVVLLSSRPGRVLQEFGIDAARPRGIDSGQTVERAMQIKARLNEEVCAMSADTEEAAALTGLDNLENVPPGAGRHGRDRRPGLARAVAQGARGGDRPRRVGTRLPAQVKPHDILPGPGQVFPDLWHQLTHGQLWQAIGTTLRRAVIGFALALVVGSLVGLVVARVPPVRAAVGSMITGLQTIPSVVWIPFAIILFGNNTPAILFMVIITAAPSIANGLIAGVDFTPPLLLRAGKSMGLRRSRCTVT